MSEVLDAIREKFPAYKDVLDDELAVSIGQKYPQYLEHPDFKAEYDRGLGVGVIPGAGVEGETGARPGPEMIPPRQPAPVVPMSSLRAPRFGQQKTMLGQAAAGVGNAALNVVGALAQSPEYLLMGPSGIARAALGPKLVAELAKTAPTELSNALESAVKGDIQGTSEHLSTAIGAYAGARQMVAPLAPKTAEALAEMPNVRPFSGMELETPKGAVPPAGEVPGLETVTPEQALAQAKAMTKEATAAYEPAKPPKPEVPATPAEPYETVLEAIRNAKADTTGKVQALFPAAQLNRQQAAELRRQAFGQAKTTPPPAEPLLDRLQTALDKGDFAQIKKTAQKLAVFDEVPESTFKEPEVPKPLETKLEAPAEAPKVEESPTRALNDPIVSAAFKMPDGTVFDARNEGGVTHMEAAISASNSGVNVTENEAGFLTESGKFLNREEAYKHASTTKQIIESLDTFAPSQLHTGKTELSSETSVDWKSSKWGELEAGDQMAFMESFERRFGDLDFTPESPKQLDQIMEALFRLAQGKVKSPKTEQSLVNALTRKEVNEESLKIAKNPDAILDKILESQKKSSTPQPLSMTFAQFLHAPREGALGDAVKLVPDIASKTPREVYDTLVEQGVIQHPKAKTADILPPKVETLPAPQGDISIGPGARSPSDAPAAPPQARAAGAVHEEAPPENRPLGPASPLAAKVQSFWQDLKTTIRGAAGDSMPKTTAADRETGEAGVRYASSKLAARPLAQRFVAQSLEGTGVDPVKFGAALTEDNLVSIRESFRGEATRLLAEGKSDLAQEATEAADKVATIIGAEGSPFRTQDELLDYLERPDVRQAVAQHAQLWQEIIDPQFRDAKGIDPDVPLPSRGQVTGARINLKAILADEDLQGAVKPIRASAPSLTATFKKKSPFTIKAKGTGEAYDIDYNSIIANTFERQLEIANKNAFDKRLVETGNAVIDRPGQSVIIKGEPAVPFPLVRKVYVSGQGGEKKLFPMAQNIYVRKELAGEYRAAANVDPKFKIPYVTATMNLLNRSALAGLTDFTVHMSNQATALFNRPVSGKLLFDTLLSATGRADIPVTLVKTWIKAYHNNAGQIAELTEIGAMRSKMTHGWNPLGKTLAHTDALTRLMLDDTFKSLAEEGVIENTETARREYVNQIGQYNRRLQGPLTRILRDSGFGPFVTAGKTFNAMGVKMITLSPGVKGANAMAEVALRANVLSKWVGAAVMLGTLNYLLSGNMLGRKGTPLGSLDLGKNDRSGKQLSLPLLDLMGLGRGLRVTGTKGAYQSLRLGLQPGDAMDAAARDILNAWSAPALGPPARFGSELATGYPPALNVPRASRVVPPGGGQFGENLKAAVLDANPVVASVRKAIEGKTIPEIMSSQLPRFTMVPGKTENLVANYPRIVTMAQGNAFIEDVIYQARRLPQDEKLLFIREQVKRLPAPLRNKAMSEIKRRRVMVVEKNAAK